MAVDKEKYCCEWASVLLRIAVVVLFASAGIAQWIKGAGTSAAAIQQMFEGSSFPHWIVLLYSWAIPYIDVVLAGWFLFGFALRTGWFVLGLYVITLGFGLNVAQQWLAGGLTYLFVLISVAGIYFCAPGDWKFGLDFGKKRRKKARR